MTWRVIQADVLEGLAQLGDASVQTVVTSPPYWGLRDYGTAAWDGGDAACDHAKDRSNGVASSTLDGGKATTNHQREASYVHTCGKCGARRIDSQLGLEATPDEYVERMVEVFRAVRRVLRDDGTVWLNLGDSYAAGTMTGALGPNSTINARGQQAQALPPRKPPAGLKPKDLVGIPWRVAFALQADGWWLRSDIVWAKPNPMPESVTDRPTKSHEYVFLLSKSPRYFFDADAVREPHAWPDERPRMAYNGKGNPYGRLLSGNAARLGNTPAGRNLRSVWNIPTEPFPGAHFATFPKKLVEPCVKAGSSERGSCGECGAPFVRQVNIEPMKFRPSARQEFKRQPGNVTERGLTTTLNGTLEEPAKRTTTGWATSCGHTGEPVPCTVLDPFCGSGTVGLVALRHGRSFVGVELSADYAEMARHRIADDAPMFNVPAEVAE